MGGRKSINKFKRSVDPGGILLKEKSRRGHAPTASELLAQQQLEFENFLLPYDELVRLGRIDVGQSPLGGIGGMMTNSSSGLDPSSPYYGLRGNESRLSRGISAYEESLASSDPAFAAYRDSIRTQARSLSEGGIPDDFRRTLTEELRSSQAARGTLEGGTPGLEEAIRLMGGQEAIRTSRLNEVTNYLSGIQGGALGALLPNAGQYLNLGSNQSGLQAQMDQFRTEREDAQADDTRKTIGMIGGMFI